MIGEALAAACSDRSVLARIAGPIGDAARIAASELVTLGDRERRARRAAWIAAARAPVPAGFRGVDPSWIERALVDRPPRTRELVAGAAPASAVDVWLVRAAVASIPPMPVVDPDLARPRFAGDVVRVAAAGLHAWLEEVGLDQLAFALGGHAGDAFGARLVAAVARIAKPPRAGQLGGRRAAIERARVTLDSTALARIGARSIAPHLDELARRQLVHRLPCEIGDMLVTELSAFARVPIDQTPSWRALAAA